MVAWMPIIGAGIAAASLLKKNKSSGGNPYLDASMGQFSQINQPTAEEMKVQLQQYVEAGIITPEQAQTMLMDGSAYDQIQVDPGTRAAQGDALRQLSDISNQGGMTAIDRSRMMEIADQMQTANRGAQQAITQNMAERGVSGSGAELAARLSGQQMAAGDSARMGAQVAADAQSRALQAIMAKGNLGGQMNQQDYSQAAAKAQARDAINQFNTTNKQNVINANVDRRTAANAANLTNKQNIGVMNTQQENTNRLRDADLKQRVFENQMNVARGKTGQLGQMAANAEKDKDRDAAYQNSLLGLGASLMGSKS